MDAERRDPGPTRADAAASGAIAAALALSVGELVAGLSSQLRSPVVAVGDSVIDRAPRWFVELGIERFGRNDKSALVIGIVVLSALFAAALGVASRRRRWVGVAGFAAFAGLGVAAAHAVPDAGSWAGAPSVAAGLVGTGVLVWLLDRAGAGSVPTTVEEATARRQFVLGGISFVAAAAILGSTGRWLQDRAVATASRMRVVLPTAASASRVPVDGGVDLGVPGVGPWQTPNSSFYRIDTALVTPQIATEGWSLRVHGMVDRELELTFDELLGRRLVEEDITLCCVSNEVGGSLVGNARWLGARLDDLLAEVGVSPDADQIVGRSSDGFTAGFPVATLADGRPALVAVGMNGDPLPVRHGFPARLVVPGLYGYVSATKWLTEIEITRFDRFDPYWIERQWARLGPVKATSRIDAPRRGAALAAGEVPVGGVAWAQPVGVARVQVRIDDGDWVEAELGDEANTNTWRQWRHRWSATPGRHTITVRAVDHDGVTQTEERAQPFPDGASGWHSITVEVA